MQVNSACVRNRRPVLPNTRSPTPNLVRRTGRGYLAGELAAQDPLPGAAETGDKPTNAADEQAVTPVGFTGVAIEAVDRGGADPHLELVIPGGRPFHLIDAENLGRTVVVIDDGLHDPRKSGMVRIGIKG